MTMHRLPRLAALLSAIFILVAACSSDGDDAALPDEPTTRASEPNGDEAGNDEPIPVESHGDIDEAPADLVPFFGGNDDQCPSTTLSNDPTDQAMLSAAVDCFFAQYEAGRPVVWDLDAPTVEGDAIRHRFAYDGADVTIVIDNRLDSFGSPVVDAQICADIERTTFIPVGVGCAPIDHPGFPEAD